MRRSLHALAALVLFGCATEDEPSPPTGPTCEGAPLPAVPPTCNGAEGLCARRYSDVAFPTTHNAMSNADDGWAVPNQEHGIGRQLADGVRGLMLDVHPSEGGTFLCHGVCQLGRRPLADGLADLRSFLDCHPGEVVTIIFESYVTAGELEAAFVAADALRLTHPQVPGDPWPTLGELVAAGERLVVLTDSHGGERPWLLDVWAHAWETPYAFASAAEMTCAPNRGDPGNPLYILNHFITNPVAAPEFAETVNHDPFFLERALACRGEAGQLPNFPTVDFYTIGDLFPVVDALNAP
ncbi:MAG: hypothetical protein IT373_30410 [Polyangiaceae bacterium]|nr:hypothetical protein [Polyangiaceae bacterium]